jgi:hypothetical protein
MATNYKWTDPATGKETAQGIGNPTLIAPGTPSGATKVASPDQLKGLTESQIWRDPNSSSIYQLPKVDPVLDAQKVSPDVPVPEETNDVASYMAGLDTGNKGLQAQLDMINKQSASEKEIPEIRRRQDELTKKAVGVQEKALPIAEQFGLTENTKNLQGIMPQIANLKAQFDNAEIAQEGRVGSASSIYGRQALIQRQRAVELAGLSAIAQAYQGNIELATQTAKQMVDMELAPIQTQIDNQKWQLEQVQDQLTRDESRKADSLNLVLEERQRLLNEEKEKKTEISKLAIEIAKLGADQSVIESVMKSGNIDDAIELASPFLSKITPDSPLKFVSGTLTQPSGYFNETTGVFTPLGGGVSPIKQEDLDKANKISTLVGEISQLELKDATGLIFGRLAATDNQRLADSKISQLTGLLTLDNMGVMKGVLSDADIKIIKEASTSLRRTLSEKDFRAELVKIKDTADRVIVGNEILTIDPTRQEELRQLLNAQPDLTGDELRQVYGISDFTNVEGDTNNSPETLGSLSAPYESGGNPKAIGYDTTGGYSYGTYQLTKGNIGKFLDVLSAIPATAQLARTLKGVKVGTDAFNSYWKKAVDKDPQAFKQAEEKYISQTHYEPQVKKLQSSGVNIDNYSNVLKQVVWSTSVQHGANTSIIANAYKSLKNSFKREPNEAELIAKIYDDRWSNGANFKSSTPAVKKSVFNRFQSELKTALSKLYNQSNNA